MISHGWTVASGHVRVRLAPGTECALPTAWIRKIIHKLLEQVPNEDHTRLEASMHALPVDTVKVNSLRHDAWTFEAPQKS